VIASLAFSTAWKYVAAAYGLVWLVILLYVWILRAKLGRMQVQLEAAERELAARGGAEVDAPDHSGAVA
jgi:hypothetical protein